MGKRLYIGGMKNISELAGKWWNKNLLSCVINNHEKLNFLYFRDCLRPVCFKGPCFFENREKNRGTLWEIEGVFALILN